jgi:hypothetical protein
MYKVIKYFTDLQDNNHAYNVGDEFPHKGLEVSEKRLLELSTDANRRRMPLIEKVEIVENEAGETMEEVKAKEPVEGFMNPPEEPIEEEDNEKPKKRRGRPRNDAE